MVTPLEVLVRRQGNRGMERYINRMLFISSFYHWQAFTQPKHTFAVKAEFRRRFCRELVREGVVVAFFLHLTDMMVQFCHKKDKDPVLLLLLSRMCLDLHTSTVHYLVITLKMCCVPIMDYFQ